MPSLMLGCIVLMILSRWWIELIRILDILFALIKRKKMIKLKRTLNQKRQKRDLLNIGKYSIFMIIKNYWLIMTKMMTMKKIIWKKNRKLHKPQSLISQSTMIFNSFPILAQIIWKYSWCFLKCPKINQVFLNIKMDNHKKCNRYSFEIMNSLATCNTFVKIVEIVHFYWDQRHIFIVLSLQNHLNSFMRWSGWN